jgi:Flp pilus assembly protein TadG
MMSYSNKRGSSHKRRSQRGNAVLEFAIAWSFLWLVFSGVYQYGYSFYIYNRLMTAVSDAAELGAKITYDTANAAAYTTTLQNMVLYGDETAGTSPIVSGLTASNVTVSVSTDANSIPHDLTITITNYSINALFGSITLNGKPRATMKYFGQVICSTC